MPFTIECPQCQRKLAVPETMLGLRVKCPSCDTAFEARGTADGAAVNLSAPVGPSSEPLDYDPDFGLPPERRKPHRGSMILTLGILGLVFTCIPPVAWVLGGAALSMASSDLYEMEKARMNREGLRLTNAGRICGIVAVAISFVCSPLACIAINIAGRTSNSQ